jgi:hypothetical protein
MSEDEILLLWSLLFACTKWALLESYKRKFLDFCNYIPLSCFVVHKLELEKESPF